MAVYIVLEVDDGQAPTEVPRIRMAVERGSKAPHNVAELRDILFRAATAVPDAICKVPTHEFPDTEGAAKGSERGGRSG